MFVVISVSYCRSSKCGSNVYNLSIFGGYVIKNVLVHKLSFTQNILRINM